MNTLPSKTSTARIGTVGSGQLAVISAAGLAAALRVGVLEIPSSIAVGAVGWTLLWYLVFAASGAWVSGANMSAEWSDDHPQDHTQYPVGVSVRMSADRRRITAVVQ